MWRVKDLVSYFACWVLQPSGRWFSCQVRIRLLVDLLGFFLRIGSTLSLHALEKNLGVQHLHPLTYCTEVSEVYHLSDACEKKKRRYFEIALEEVATVSFGGRLWSIRRL